MPNATNNDEDLSYSQKAWIKGRIYAFIIILILLFQATFNVFLLVLAGILIAVFFRALSGRICYHTNWRDGICLAISIAGTILFILGLLWLIGSKLQTQISQLTETLPTTIENAKVKLGESQIGRKIVEKLDSPQSMKQAEAMAGTIFRSSFGVFGDVYIILFLGIFFTVSPSIYQKGIISLVPPPRKRKVAFLFKTLGENLKKWLKGQFIAMALIMTLTALGLAIIGVPMWLALAIIAGILNFIPNFGPLIAMIPAVLVALLISPVTAIIVAGMYVFIQLLESNLITPMIQQKLIKMPPALIIIAQLLMIPFTGALGLLLATPLMLIIIILVKELHVKENAKAVE